MWRSPHSCAGRLLRYGYEKMTGQISPAITGESQAYRRDIGYHEKPYENCGIIPEHIGHNAGKGTSPDLDGYKQGISYRGSDISDTEVVH